jgi:uncharacterized protein with HEPN domain
MRSVEALLLDIQTAAERLQSYIAEVTEQQFLVDNKTKAAVVREVEIIGEAARRTPKSFRTLHPEIPWADLTQLRNLYAHVYERVDYRRVWLTATRTVPAIAAAVAALVPAEPPDA